MSTLRTLVLAALVPVAAMVLFSTPANLAPPNIDAAFEALQTRIVDLERDNAILRAHLDSAVRDGERTAAAVDDAFSLLADQDERIERSLAVAGERRPTGSSSQALERRVDDLADLLVHLRRDGDDLYLEGANLHVRNGAGSTATVNGLGNLIVGYNEARANGDLRSGSHVLVLGSQNDYVGFGGIVAGRGNRIGGAFSSVLGGNGNRADGPTATVVGGAANQAPGEGAVVSGGGFNVATGRFAVVGGGMQNEALGDASVVSRGCDLKIATCGGD